MNFFFIKRAFIFLIFLTLFNGLYAQSEFPAGDYWSLDAGFGMSDILTEGLSYQLILEPKLWLSPPLIVGSKLGVNYSTDEILTFEGQVYIRWNFLRLGPVEKKFNIFIQGGLGMLAAYRGDANPFDNTTKTRGSLLGDAALGVTIPLTKRWHIEASIRGGYPHIGGASITAGYKFQLPEKTKYQSVQSGIEYIEIIKTIPSNEIIKRIIISSVEYILFGPDIGRYNLGIDHDAQQLNELVLNQIAQFLKENSGNMVRIEGHANPITLHYSEADELMTLSTIRANVVAEKLKEKGVNEYQIITIAFGGTRTATGEFELRTRNRRVELMIIQFDEN
jgi:hypothetical protein